MDILSIDVETYCDLDIKNVGAYRYCEHPSFEILLFAYAFNDEPIEIVDFTAGEKLPTKVLGALMDMRTIKSAFNANFERNAIRNFIKIGINKIPATECPPSHWQCTMIKALTMGLPGSLDMVGKAMHFEEDKQKMKEGKALIQYFCKPCKPTKVNGGRIRNFPEHAPDKWETFKLYCKQDVEVERDIRNKLSRYKTTDKEQRLWELDQHINDRGVGIDLELIEKAIECDEQYQERLKYEAIELTGLKNPNSPTQLKEWIGKRLGYAVGSINKDIMPTLIKDAELQEKDEVKRILELRQLMGKTSIRSIRQ